MKKVKIKNITKINNDSKRYDIETKTHNFFANNILVHNSSGTFFTYKTKKWGFKKLEFGVCSRNIWIKKENDSNYWKIARKHNLKNKLKSLNKEIVIQGEIIGPGIQKNKYNLQELDFYVFNIVENGKRYSLEQMIKFCNNLQLKHVPILDDRVVFMTNETDPENRKWTHDEFGNNNDSPKQRLVNDLVKESIGQSKLCDVKREGVVYRVKDDPKISFKVINPEFLLKYDE